MRFECVEHGSRKFWEARIEGTSLHVRWGRIGTEGQSKTHSFATVEAAQSERDKLVREKTRKGYTLVQSDAGETTATEPSHADAAAHAKRVAETSVSLAAAAPRSEKRSAADARKLASTLEPTTRNAQGVTTWSLFREMGAGREFFEVSVAGAEIEIARGKLGLTGRVRRVALGEGESVDARVRRELAKALADGFDPGDIVAPTPDFEDDEAKLRRRAIAFLEKHGRIGYVPELEAGAGDILDSRFGGLPALDPNESAPACRACSRPMTLLVQLRHDALPSPAQ
jgi:predicted DNA-binding WGR domain protein